MSSLDVLPIPDDITVEGLDLGHGLRGRGFLDKVVQLRSSWLIDVAAWIGTPEEPLVEEDYLFVPPAESRIRAQDLPYDILSSIFPFCLPANLFEYPQPNAKVAPLLLCHICSSWRLVALTMCPRLWCQLAIILEYVTAKSSAGSGFLRTKMDVLEFWTSRMGVIPPSFHFIREHLATSITSDSFA
ncbi:hypothetical protein CPC08DRAFT_111604 [Agrocybe pediades]|nr:hypothetical protein CPC08DRAFT_111604 [Agrocybe pediades]